MEKLRQLREEIDKGTRSLDAGAGKPSTSLKRRTPLVQFMESLYVEGLDLSIGGTIVPNVATPGTYTVNSDCGEPA